ncbi:MAG: thiamine pyrophosphate-dependent enzyme [Thermodesulfobacteriota bacterium]
MSTTAGDVLIETLMEWGVEVVFGLPGDGINGIMEALRKRQEDIRFVHVRHEEAAAFMACGYAKYTGKLGVCLATSGPGGIHLLNGLYDAKLDGKPVLAITGLHHHDLLNTHSQQDVDLDRVFMDVSVYNARIMGPHHVEPVTHLACRTALAENGVAHITMPVDLQSMPLKKASTSSRNIPGHSSHTYARMRGMPNEADIRAAADVLNQGKKIAILAGQGALCAGDELEKAADILGAPIAKALLGKACVPDDSPYTTGQVGLLGTKASQKSLEECDTLLIVGSSFPYIEYYPEPGKARCVQIDINPERLGLRYPVEIGVVGDTIHALQMLIPLLKPNEDRSFIEKAQKRMREWAELMETRGTVDTKPMKPQVVAWELGKRLKENAVVACDSGTITTWWARQIPVRRGQLHTVSGTLATMACGLPYAVAAQIAYPDRQVAAFVGDGGFSMLMAEMSTCVMYNLPVKVVVIKNNTLGQIKWEQMVMLGNPEYGCALADMDYAAVGRACGAEGYSIREPAECGPILDEALNSPGPAVIEAVVDPHEPPLPPSISLSQAKEFAAALAKGTPYRGKIMTTLLTDKVREMV